MKKVSIRYDNMNTVVHRRAQGHPVAAVFRFVSLLDSGETGETDVVLFRPQDPPTLRDQP